MRLRHPLEDSALGRPDHPVLITRNQTWSALALRDAIALRAGHLLGNGIRLGDTVALVGTPCGEWIITFHALRWIGAIVFPVDPKASSARIDELCAHADAQHVVTSSPGVSTDPVQAPAHFAHPDEIALKVATSGTTGTPRVISLTHGQIMTSALASAQRIGHEPEDTWLCCLPLHHVGGLSVVLRCALYGTTVLLHEGFDASAVSNAIDEEHVSQLSLVPTMLADILDAREDRPFPSRLRVILLGGAPTRGPLLDRCRSIGAPVSLTWGMSETASQIATRQPGDLRPDPDVGTALPGITVSVENGALVVTGGIAPGGRFVTPDRGSLDEEGRVVVTGRGSDVIISGGENIDPTQVEQALLLHPGIDDAVVLGQPHPRWGERPVAICVAPEALATEDVQRWIGDRLPAFAVPDTIIWTERIPRTPLGKIDRASLRRRLSQTQGDDSSPK